MLFGETYQLLYYTIEKSTVKCSHRETVSCSSQLRVSKYMAYTHIQAYAIFKTYMRTRREDGQVCMCAHICMCVKQSWLFSPCNFPTLSMLCFCDASRHARAWPLSAISLGQSINLSIGQTACKISTWGKQN